MSINNCRAALIIVILIFLASAIVSIFYVRFQEQLLMEARNEQSIAKESADSCKVDSQKEEVAKPVEGSEVPEVKSEVKSTGSEVVNEVVKGIDPATAVKIAVDYINKNMLSAGTTATADGEIIDQNGIYQFKLKVQDKDYDAYVSKDGKLLFADGIPQAIKLDEKPKDISAQTKSTTKSNRPDVKLFVMSYCPYGLQAQKMYLPVYEVLKNKTDMGIYFVNYAMHGKKEIDENVRQYCIQKNEKAKFATYLKCFVADTQYSSCQTGDCAANFNNCLTNAKIDQVKLNACIAATDKEYNVSANFEDKSTWLSGSYPKFAIDNALNEKYGVQGSPTIIINGVDTQIGSRTPAQFLKAICDTFNNPPAECSVKLSDEQPSTGFGDGTSTTTSGGCGG